MKVATETLRGRALDHAAAQAMKLRLFESEDGVMIVVRDRNGMAQVLSGGSALDIVRHGLWRPSEDWGQAGPAIARERIGIWWHVDGWMATMELTGTQGFGKTHLEAAMRCLVTQKLGHEVEVPDRLCEGLKSSAPRKRSLR